MSAADNGDRPILQAIGRELTKARTEKRWMRSDLVRRMKHPIPTNTYACYENGTRKCPIDRLVEICRALDMDVSQLLARALGTTPDRSLGGIYALLELVSTHVVRMGKELHAIREEQSRIAALLDRSETPGDEK